MTNPICVVLIIAIILSLSAPAISMWRARRAKT